MKKAKEVLRALVGHRWWWVTLLVVALMLVLARLGIWQLDRLEERRTANAQLLAALESAPIDLNNAIDDYAATPPGQISSDLANRDVVLSGRYDYDNQRILKLQSWLGQPGVHLITPLILDGTDTAVLVDRGWIPDAEYEAGNLFAGQDGPQTVEGYIALTETIGRAAADADSAAGLGREIFRVDVAAINAASPYELAPFYVMQAPAEGAAADLPFAVPKEVDLSEGPHLDYALQWFIFSLGLGIGYVVYVYRWLKEQERGGAALEQEARLSPDNR